MLITQEGSTALILPVGRMSGVVAHGLKLSDWNMPGGMPAHITLLLPFLPAGEIDEACTDAISTICSETESISMSFPRIERFDPDIYYLTPEPAGPVIALIQRLCAAFPRVQPYDGEHRDIVPHLTVGRGKEIYPELATTLEPQLPLYTEIDRAWLMEMQSSSWTPTHIFPLGI